MPPETVTTRDSDVTRRLRGYILAPTSEMSPKTLHCLYLLSVMGAHWREKYQETGTLSRRNGVHIKTVRHRYKRYTLVKRVRPPLVLAYSLN